MNRQAGRRIRRSRSSDEDEKIEPNRGAEDDELLDEEENDYSKKEVSSGPGKILEDEIKYFLERVTYIGETNPSVLTIYFFAIINFTRIA